MDDKDKVSMLALLEQYTGGSIPKLTDQDKSQPSLLDWDLFEVFKLGLEDNLHFGPLGISLVDDTGKLIQETPDPDSQPPPSMDKKWQGFCQVLRSRPEADAACRNCDRRRAEQAFAKGEAIAYLCDHGLIDFAVPIKVGEKPLAIFFAGELVPREGENWSPQLLEPQGVFVPLADGESGVDIAVESHKRIQKAEARYKFPGDSLKQELPAPKRWVGPKKVAEQLSRLKTLGIQISHLAENCFASDRAKLSAWIRDGISHALAELKPETTGTQPLTEFKGVTPESIKQVWQNLATHLEYTRTYFGLTYLAVVSSNNHSEEGSFNLHSYAGPPGKAWEYPQHHQSTTTWAPTVAALYSETPRWKTATEIDLQRYAGLPVIKEFYDKSRRHKSTTYAISGEIVHGIPRVLLLAELNYRKRREKLSALELSEFMDIAKEITLVANVCNLVDEIDQAAERQARFAEDVAHDIRNPMNNLLTMAQFMQIKDMPLAAKEEKAVEIQAEVTRINDLSKRIWVLEELRRGRINPENKRHVSIYETLMRCRKSLSRHAKRHHVKIMVDSAMDQWERVQVNEDLLYHTILNLLDNAIKYSHKNTEVRILGESEALQFHVTFSNIGIGIPEEEKEYIFQRYYRTKNARLRVREGSGIGLSIVKVFADRYGDIEVSSTPVREGSKRHLTNFRLSIRKEKPYV